MTKRKASVSADISATPTSKRRPSVSSKGGQSSSAKRSAPQRQRSISNEEIGHVAGDLWRFLDRDGAQTFAAIKKAIDAPTDLVLAGIGWLAREDKLEFSGSGRSMKIALR